MTRPRRTPRLVALALLGLGCAVAAPLLSSCDTGAIFYFVAPKYDEMRIVSAFPAVAQPDGTYQRVCTPDQAADAFLLNVIHLSTNRNPPNANLASPDRDKSIHPNDVVDGPDDGNDARVVDGGASDDILLSRATNYNVQIDCIDPVPNANLGSTCLGAPGATGSPERVDHIAFQDRRRNGHDIMIVLDQSGSTSGLVDSATFLERNNPNISGQFGANASDAGGYRIAAVKQFIQQLNNEDRVGIVTFSQGTLSVPCAGATGGTAGDNIEECYGINRDRWIDPQGLDSLTGTASGRANLWEAVEFAWDHLEGLPATNRGEAATAPRTRHVVVISDGPDTCNESEALSDTACDGICSTVSYDQVLEKVEAKLDQVATNANALPIRMHFVQFESKGYPGRDARQVELACLTGGHYQYVNSNLFSAVNIQAFISALEVALINVRYSLMGYFQLAIDAPSFANDSAAPLGSPPGSQYALSGLIDLQQTANVLPQNRVFPFGVGQGEGASAATQWDRRPVVRKGCTANTQCGGADGDGCTVVCSAETHVCPNGADGIDNYVGAACTLDGGAAGSCCEGTCSDPGVPCGVCQ